MYMNEIIAYGSNTVNSRRAKRKPPKGGYHAQMKQKEKCSMFMHRFIIQRFILHSPPLRIPFYP